MTNLPPKTGQLRETKEHGKQMRVLKRERTADGYGAFVLSNGKPVYELVSYEEVNARGLGCYLRGKQ